MANGPNALLGQKDLTQQTEEEEQEESEILPLSSEQIDTTYDLSRQASRRYSRRIRGLQP